MVLETDSEGVAAKLTADEQDRTIYGPLVEEIKSLLLSFGDSSVRLVRRSANETAHGLAKEGCGNKLCKTSCIRNQLVLDSLLN